MADTKEPPKSPIHEESYQLGPQQEDETSRSWEMPHDELNALKPKVDGKSSTATPQAETPAPGTEKATVDVETSPPSVAAKPAKKEHDGFNKQLSRAHYDRRQAEARADKAERELADLRGKAATATTEKSAAPSLPPVEKFATWDEWSVQPVNANKQYEEYLDARDDWRAEKRGLITRKEAEAIAEQRIAEERQAEADARIRAKVAETQVVFDASTLEAKQKYTDYDEVVENSELELNPTMIAFIRRRPKDAGELFYHLGSHPEDCRRIAELDEFDEVIDEMALLHATLKGRTHRPASEAPAVTRAPAPPSPVGGTSRATPLNLATASMSEFSRLRAEQRRARAAAI